MGRLSRSLRILALAGLSLPSVVTAQPAAASDPAPFSIWREPATGMEFVWLPAGELTMGSPLSEAGREDGETPHRVRLSRGFWLGRYEVTQSEWQQVMHGNPSQFPSCGRRCPQESVTWFEALNFADRLGRLSPGARFRLPSEAEWEYACRAGTTMPFSTGATLTTDQANFDGRYPAPGSPPGVFRAGPLPVGSFAANPWGLFDLHGNVWEWTADEHCPYPAAAAAPLLDPRALCGAELKVIRGGSWVFGGDSARCALRYTHRPQDRGYSLGLRLVREVVAAP